MQGNDLRMSTNVRKTKKPKKAEFTGQSRATIINQQNEDPSEANQKKYIALKIN